jgi:hypothetical protein
MSKKYIRQINDKNFFYPNYEKAQYDVEIVHDINNSCVSGDVTTFSATTISQTGITFTIDSSWLLNNAKPWINDAGELIIYSVHMLAPSQDYFKPWRLVEHRYTTSTGSTTYSETGTTFTVTATQAGVSSFTSGTYYFEVRFIGHDCTYNVCFSEDIIVIIPTPNPTPTPSLTPNPTPTPSVTPSAPSSYTVAVYASTDSALSPGPNGVRVTYRINAGSWSGFTATCSSNPNTPSFMLNINVAPGDDLDIGLRNYSDTNNITAGYSTTIPASTTGTCGQTSPQAITNINSSFSIYLNAQVITQAVVNC